MARTSEELRVLTLESHQKIEDGPALPRGITPRKAGPSLLASSESSHCSNHHLSPRPRRFLHQSFPPPFSFRKIIFLLSQLAERFPHASSRSHTMHNVDQWEWDRRERYKLLHSWATQAPPQCCTLSSSFSSGSSEEGSTEAKKRSGIDTYDEGDDHATSNAVALARETTVAAAPQLASSVSFASSSGSSSHACLTPALASCSWFTSELASSSSPSSSFSSSSCSPAIRLASSPMHPHLSSKTTGPTRKPLGRRIRTISAPSNPHRARANREHAGESGSTRKVSRLSQMSSMAVDEDSDMVAETTAGVKGAGEQSRWRAPSLSCCSTPGMSWRVLENSDAEPSPSPSLSSPSASPRTSRIRYRPSRSPRTHNKLSILLSVIASVAGDRHISNEAAARSMLQGFEKFTAARRLAARVTSNQTRGGSSEPFRRRVSAVAGGQQTQQEHLAAGIPS